MDIGSDDASSWWVLGIAPRSTFSGSVCQMSWLALMVESDLVRIWEPLNVPSMVAGLKLVLHRRRWFLSE